MLIDSNLKTVSKDTGIPYDRMYKWTKGVSKPKIEDYNLLLQYFSDGNFSNSIEIMRPEGEIVTNKVARNKETGLIPFYNADFMAGRNDNSVSDGSEHPDYYMDVPEFAGCIAFRAFGDSMEKLIKSSSVLFGLKLDSDWREYIEYGQIYGITMKNGQRYLKYIRRAKSDRHFLLKSENENYDDFEVPKEKIKNIWLIQGWIDKRA